MFSLYHNALSTCSQKVRMAFAEKQVVFDSHLVDLVNGEQHARDFVAISPKHVVPVLVSDGTVLRESTVINEYVDTLSDAPSLIPRDPLAQARMRMWVKRIDDDIHGKTSGVLTHAIWTRKAVGGRTSDQIEHYLAALPDVNERELRCDLIAKGVRSFYLEGALQRMNCFIADMNDALARGKWLVGDAFTLADIAVMPYVLRVRDTGFSGLWTGGRRPAVERWLTELEARPAYQQAVIKWAPAEMMGFLRSFADEDAEYIAQLITSIPQQESV